MSITDVSRTGISTTGSVWVITRVASCEPANAMSGVSPAQRTSTVGVMAQTLRSTTSPASGGAGLGSVSPLWPAGLYDLD